MDSRMGVEGVRAAERWRSNLTALIMRNLSPMLDTPISWRVVWSSSRRMSPRMSFARKVAAWLAHLMSVSQRATWASVQVRIKSAYAVPGGGSKKELIEEVGVVGKGELWPRMAETKERGAKEDMGDTGDGGESNELKDPLAVIADIVPRAPRTLVALRSLALRLRVGPEQSLGII